MHGTGIQTNKGLSVLVWGTSPPSCHGTVMSWFDFQETIPLIRLDETVQYLYIDGCFSRKPHPALVCCFWGNPSITVSELFTWYRTTACKIKYLSHSVFTITYWHKMESCSCFAFKKKKRETIVAMGKAQSGLETCSCCLIKTFCFLNLRISYSSSSLYTILVEITCKETIL